MDVLLVEPDNVLAEIYVAALRRGGFKTTRVTSAQDAVHAVDKSLPRCIILEVQLSSHNGVEFLYELRSHPDWRDLPVIIHSIVPESDFGLTPKLRKKLGIVSCLYKPNTSLEQLVSATKEAALL